MIIFSLAYLAFGLKIQLGYRKNCRKCHAELSNKKTFCGGCGNKVISKKIITGRVILSILVLFIFVGASVPEEVKDSPKEDLSNSNLSITKVDNISLFEEEAKIIENKSNVYSPQIFSTTISFTDSPKIYDSQAFMLISTCKQLQDINKNLRERYLLTNDIDCQESHSWNNGAGFLPIGRNGSSFIGYFNGNGYDIRNVFINSSEREDVGLFGYSTGEITNFRIINLYVLGKSNVGGVVGSNFGKLTNVHTTGYAESKMHGVGGIGGYNWGEISYTSSNVTVMANGYEDAGGLVGKNMPSGKIILSFSGGNVSGSNYDCGGFVGENQGYISNSYSLSNVNGDKRVGGFTGWNYRGTIENSFSMSIVYGNENVGGFEGDYIPGTTSNSYWDKSLSGLSTSGGGIGFETREFARENNFIGWDFKNVWEMRNDGFPVLKKKIFEYNTYSSSVTYQEVSPLSKIEEVNASLCGLSTGDLIVCFGNPLYAIGWERSSTGQNLEPNSYKFLFNNYSIITKGKYNSATKLIETYQVLIREDSENSTLIKNIQCEKN